MHILPWENLLKTLTTDSLQTIYLSNDDLKLPNLEPKHQARYRLVDAMLGGCRSNAIGVELFNAAVPTSGVVQLPNTLLPGPG